LDILGGAGIAMAGGMVLLALGMLLLGADRAANTTAMQARAPRAGPEPY
jgi:hypothetical protein